MENETLQNDGESGLANVMSKILKKQTGGKSIVLSRAKTDKELSLKKNLENAPPDTDFAIAPNPLMNTENDPSSDDESSVDNDTLSRASSQTSSQRIHQLQVNLIHN